MWVVDHRDVLKLIAEGGQVVNVFPLMNIVPRAIRGAIHLPLPKLLHNAEHVLDKKRPIVVYCRDCL